LTNKLSLISLIRENQYEPTIMVNLESETGTLPITARRTTVARVLIPCLFGLLAFISAPGISLASGNPITFLEGPLGEVSAVNGEIKLKIDRDMGVSLDLADHETRSLAVPPGAGYSVCTPILLSNRRIGFRLVMGKRRARPLSNEHGPGQAITLEGRSTKPDLSLKLTIELYRNFPGSAFLRFSLANRDNRPVRIARLVTVPLKLVDKASPAADSTVWSFQGGSYRWGQDYIAPLAPNYEQQNYQGANAPGIGDGIPLTVLWSRRGALSLSPLTTRPDPWALPVRVDSSGTTYTWVELRKKIEIAPGETFEPPPAMITVSQGDFFNPVRGFAEALADLGLKPPPYPPEAYQVPWCTWGLGERFTVKDIEGRLKELNELGVKVVTIDAGWYTCLGDWEPNRRIFPEGEKSLRELTKKLHQEGFTARLWWSPFGAADSSRTFREHPDWFIRNKEGKPVKGPFNTWALCPADPRVKEWIIDLTKRIFGEWDFDGLKIDGAGINFAEPCYNRKHNHTDPWDSPRALPDLYRAIYTTAVSLKPSAVIEVCPCGIVPDLYHIPYYNLPVTSDPAPFYRPKGIWQARIRAKFLKALFGPRAPVHMDYVEWGSLGPLTHKDFASQVGVGGVAATMYAEFGPGYQVRLPGQTQFSRPTAHTCALLPETEKVYYRQWLAVYKRLKLYDGEYLNLYDIAFDRPETHVVARGDTLNYAFYAGHEPGRNFYSGPIELRGLKPGITYRLVDSVRRMVLGTGIGPVIDLEVQFADNLLIAACPVK